MRFLQLELLDRHAADTLVVGCIIFRNCSKFLVSKIIIVELSSLLFICIYKCSADVIHTETAPSYIEVSYQRNIVNVLFFNDVYTCLIIVRIRQVEKLF